MILNKQKVIKSANDYAVRAYGVPTISCSESDFDNGKEDFKAGVAYAEEEMDIVMVEFYKWYDLNTSIYPRAIKFYDTSVNKWVVRSISELFKQFLIQRDE
jgi:hypothetical protein